MAKKNEYRDFVALVLYFEDVVREINRYVGPILMGCFMDALVNGRDVDFEFIRHTQREIATEEEIWLYEAIWAAVKPRIIEYRTRYYDDNILRSWSETKEEEESKDE